MACLIETEPVGLLFDYDDPRPEQVDIADIARALSNQCRFGGFSRGFYSVAEHAVLVHRLVRDAGLGPAICFAALHHDSHEAYLGDVPTPLKKKLGLAWEDLQWSVDCAIAQKLDLSARKFAHPAIKAADAAALLIEAAVVKTSGGVGPQWGNDTLAEVPWGAVACMAPKAAEREFLATHIRAARRV